MYGRFEKACIVHFVLELAPTTLPPVNSTVLADARNCIFERLPEHSYRLVLSLKEYREPLQHRLPVEYSISLFQQLRQCFHRWLIIHDQEFSISSPLRSYAAYHPPCLDLHSGFRIARI